MEKNKLLKFFLLSLTFLLLSNCALKSEVKKLNTRYEGLKKGQEQINSILSLENQNSSLAKKLNIILIATEENKKRLTTMTQSDPNLFLLKQDLGEFKDKCNVNIQSINDRISSLERDVYSLKIDTELKPPKPITPAKTIIRRKKKQIKKPQTYSHNNANNLEDKLQGKIIDSIKASSGKDILMGYIYFPDKILSLEESRDVEKQAKKFLARLKDKDGKIIYDIREIIGYSSKNDSKNNEFDEMILPESRARSIFNFLTANKVSVIGIPKSVGRVERYGKKKGNNQVVVITAQLIQPPYSLPSLPPTPKTPPKSSSLKVYPDTNSSSLAPSKEKDGVPKNFSCALPSKPTEKKGWLEKFFQNDDN